MIDFYLVVRLIVVQVVISSEVIYIEVITIPMRDVRIPIYTQCYLLDFCVRIVCPNLIEEQLFLGLIVD